MAQYDVFAARERAGWADEDIVAAYVDKFGPVTDHVARRLVERSACTGKTVLDLCCGQGTLTAMLCGAGAHVTGLDFSDEMLTRAAKNAPAADLRQGDAASLPFEAGSFDQVFCNFGLMHLPDQPAALSEVARVLRDGGSFVMATWAAPDASPAFGTVFGAIKAHADFGNAPAQPDLFAFARPDDAEALMAASGLRLVSHQIEPAFWELSDARDLFDIFLTATVAASQLMKGQTPEVVAAIEAQVTATVRENFRVESGYLVPVNVAIAEATR